MEGKSSTNEMVYSKFGGTDMMVSKLAMGGFQLGTVHGTEGEAEAIESVIRALGSGINLIDVAPWYGFGTAEIVLGKALRGVPRKDYYVATKVGRYHSDYERMFDFSRQRTLESVRESLEKLGVDYVDLIQVHDLEFAPSLEMVLEETLPALEEVIRAGKAKYIGITGYPLHKLKEVVERSHVKIDAIQSYCRYNLFDQSLADYIPFFQERRLGILNSASLGMGLLGSGPLPQWHPGTQEIKEAALRAQAHCLEESVSLPKLALNYVFRRTDISSNVIGFCTLKHLEENLSNAIDSKLSDKEEHALRYVRTNCFGKLSQSHWEGVELEKYHRKLFQQLS